MAQRLCAFGREVAGQRRSGFISGPASHRLQKYELIAEVTELEFSKEILGVLCVEVLVLRSLHMSR